MTTVIVDLVPAGLGGNIGPAPQPVYGTCGAVFDRRVGEAAEQATRQQQAAADARAVERRQWEVEEAQRRSDRALHIRGRIDEARGATERAALTVALMVLQLGLESSYGRMLNPKHDDPRELCPERFRADWRWGHDARVLIVYTPSEIARWFAPLAADASLTCATLSWKDTGRFGRTKQRSAKGWPVGPSTITGPDGTPWGAWVFPDGRFALGAGGPMHPRRSFNWNFSPLAVSNMVRQLGYDR